jgi:hypothetical protein
MDQAAPSPDSQVLDKPNLTERRSLTSARNLTQLRADGGLLLLRRLPLTRRTVASFSTGAHTRCGPKTNRAPVCCRIGFFANALGLSRATRLVHRFSFRSSLSGLVFAQQERT